MTILGFLIGSPTYITNILSATHAEVLRIFHHVKSELADIQTVR